MLVFRDADEVDISDAQRFIVDGKKGQLKDKQFFIYNDDAGKQYSDIILTVTYDSPSDTYFDDDFVLKLFKSNTQPTENDWYSVGKSNTLNIGDIEQNGGDDTTSFWVRILCPPNKEAQTIEGIHITGTYLESLYP